LKSELFENQNRSIARADAGVLRRSLAKRMVPWPAAISTSGGSLAEFTRRSVFAIAHWSNEAMRFAGASTKPSRLLAR
jgi:hypothetical protein